MCNEIVMVPGTVTCIYCAVNAHWERHIFELPVIPEGMQWEIVAYTADEKAKEDGRKVGNTIDLMERSVMVLIAKSDQLI